MIGKHITPKDKEDFYQICNSLGKFTGALRLFGKISGSFCEADLLIHEGYIIGATCENFEKGEVYLGENALKKVKEHFMKSAGRLDVYQFSKGDMEATKRDNFKAMLQEKIPLDRIGMHIKPLEPKIIKKSNDEKGVFGTISFQQPSFQREFKVSEKPLMEIKNEIQRGENKSESLIGKQISPKEIPKLFEGISSVEGLEKKKNLLETLKEKRWVVDKEIAERISKFWSEKTGSWERKSDEKVKTKIDELYELIKKNKTVKLNDALAKRLNVSRMQIESWAVILEEHNLIELKYPAIGEPEIRIIEKG